MIDIATFQGYDIDKIKKIIASEKTDNYTIVVPKSTQQSFSDSMAIADDYAKGAYVGQRLSDISTEFSYNMVSPTEFYSFEFEVATKDQDELAETLLEISYGYVNDPLEDVDFDFNEEVQEYIDCLDESDDMACPSYIEVFEEFSTTDGDEDE